MMAILCAGLAGCVQRRMFITSNPPGAQVFINDTELGQTPLAVHFPYYGTHEIRLVREGYQTLSVEQPVPAPWYEVPPLDLVSENFIPRELRDHRSFHYDLVPRTMVPQRELIGRAEEFRRRHQHGQTAVPVGPPPATPLFPSPPPPEVVPLR